MQDNQKHPTKMAVDAHAVACLDMCLQNFKVQLTALAQTGNRGHVLRAIASETKALRDMHKAYDLPGLDVHFKDLAQALHTISRKHKLEAEDQAHLQEILGATTTVLSALVKSYVKGSTKKQESAESKREPSKIGVFVQDEEVAAQITTPLSDAGHRVSKYDSADDLEAAVQGGQVDLAIVDPVASNALASAVSIEALLKHNPNQIPIIMLSNHLDIASRLTALRAGIKSYLTKPIVKNELVSEVNSILLKRQENKIRVLIVDDDPLQTEFYEIALEDEGFIVHIMNNPLLLLTEVEQFGPNVIILDYMMPDCSGLEAAEILRGDPRYTKLPIIFISSTPEAALRRNLIELFSNAFLEKPIDVQVLVQTIKDISTKAHNVKTNIEKISQRPSKSHLEYATYFFTGLEELLQNKDAIDKHTQPKFLALLSLDSVDTIKEQHGSIALSQLEDAIEQWLTAHTQIQGHGCRYGDHAFLVSLVNRTDANVDMQLSAFEDEVEKQVFSRIIPKHDILLSLGMVALDSRLPDTLHGVMDLLESDEGVQDFGSLAEKPALSHSVAAVSYEAIESALEQQAYELAFQPIIKPDEDDHIFEVQTRLKIANGQLLAPAQFRTVLEKRIDDGYYQLDRWVIENAFKSLEKTKGRGGAEFSIVIKLYPDLKKIERLLTFIYNVRSNSRLRGEDRVYFSISESAILGQLPLAQKVISAFEAAHCGFMLDHCLGNQESIKTIQGISNVDFIKLHPNVCATGVDGTSNVGVINGLKAALGTKHTQIIVPFVEDEAKLEEYWGLGIRYFQGYFIHRPSPDMKYDRYQRSR